MQISSVVFVAKARGGINKRNIECFFPSSFLAVIVLLVSLDEAEIKMPDDSFFLFFSFKFFNVILLFYRVLMLGGLLLTL